MTNGDGLTCVKSNCADKCSCVQETILLPLKPSCPAKCAATSSGPGQSALSERQAGEGRAGPASRQGANLVSSSWHFFTSRAPFKHCLALKGEHPFMRMHSVCVTYAVSIC